MRSDAVRLRFGFKKVRNLFQRDRHWRFRRVHLNSLQKPQRQARQRKTPMAEPDEPEKVWDEYDWERFLQQQDRKTEKYMELLERYIDHPDRDQIIAREMGWTHLLNDNGERWAEEVEELFEEEMQGGLDDGEGDDDDDADEDESEDDDYEVHPLYQAA